jgi:hypothetical protein
MDGLLCFRLDITALTRWIESKGGLGHLPRSHADRGQDVHQRHNRDRKELADGVCTYILPDTQVADSKQCSIVLEPLALVFFFHFSNDKVITCHCLDHLHLPIDYPPRP